VDGARLRLLELEAAGSTLKDLLAATLDLAEELTGSQIGFFHFVEDDQKTPIDRPGIWADCVRSGPPLVREFTVPVMRAYPEEAYRRQVVESWGAAVRDMATRGGKIPPAEYRITTRTGTVRTMLVAGVPVGENLLVTFVDVTEARALQAQAAPPEK
jgi:hypothetical protein